MLCETKNVSLYQNLIYLMNDFGVRNEILRYHLLHSDRSDLYRWMGTWVVRVRDNTLYWEQWDSESLGKKPTRSHISVREVIRSTKKKWKNTSVFTIFTVCLVYDLSSVHYVSFLYDPKTLELLSFDPGVELYPHGQKTILPMIHRIFADEGLLKSHKRYGVCSNFRFKKRYYGVQFNGKTEHALPADAFCQSWTLFFFLRLFYATKTPIRDFLERWCRIQPRHRESFLCSQFLLPTLLYFPKISKKFEGMIPSELCSSYRDELMQPLENCLFRSFTTRKKIK